MIRFRLERAARPTRGSSFQGAPRRRRLLGQAARVLGTSLLLNRQGGWAVVGAVSSLTEEEPVAESDRSWHLEFPRHICLLVTAVPLRLYSKVPGHCLLPLRFHGCPQSLQTAAGDHLTMGLCYSSTSQRGPCIPGVSDGYIASIFKLHLSSAFASSLLRFPLYSEATGIVFLRNVGTLQFRNTTRTKRRVWVGRGGWKPAHTSGRLVT